MSVYNFCAGPAMLPPEVMKKAQKEFIDWQNLGVSVMEISHRSEPFLELAHKSEESLRRLMNISNDYAILFMHGGGRGQFSAVPLNLHQEGKQAVYCQTGTWSFSALDEANKFTQTQKFNIRNDQNSVASVIPVDQWQLPEEASYIHYCTNETVDGIELFDVPKHASAPIVADMSSNILSREIDVNKFDLIYAGAQKNIGPSGLAIVIVKKDLLSRPGLAKPGIFDYALESKQQSMFNTPPTFAWYLAAEVFAWLEANGGVAAMEAHNRDKAALLYDFIDNNDFYQNNIDTSCRSLMNVPFLLKDESLNKAFLTQSQNAGLLALEGHRSVGGMRASIYNAMPKAGVEALVDFMFKFSKEHK
ncbi:3-phosphoserine/phosphohydroxythreonine transaminase [Pseudoalteromonas denitrificans]|uniref:Phosphoserine aminotransferase n=1 Tax=Pseudoalteromonas denitrificans DSM 6059 TaxID=1123010 RepID=A0A1I1PIB8_9GAMM|nr:3-phosphoserine/phosphohydroxythreonine transaminase [Pseudoalteromonas denitrificans]SFD09594.1 phosphoserine aminotransferase apoenzyme [Pseudoalteromonas denitrificans DSM 6059]